MKRLNYLFMLLLTCCLCTTLWSCSDDDDSKGKTEAATYANVEAPSADNIFSTSAIFKLSTKGIESCAYKVVEGEGAETMDGAIIYAEAQELSDGIKTLNDGDTDVTVYGLEGNKTYTVYFAFKMNDTFEVKRFVITTPAYSQVVTMIQADMFSIKFHVEVPEDEYYQLNLLDLETYNGYKLQFGHTDLDFIYSPWRPSNSPRFKGPHTFTLKNGDDPYKLEGCLNGGEYSEARSFPLHPGTGYAMFISQVNADGTTEGLVDGELEAPDDNAGILLDSRVATKPMAPNVKEYSESIEEVNGLTFTGRYAKTVFFTQQAIKGDGEVSINFDKLTERTAYITLTPSENIFRYAYTVIDEADYQGIIDYIGEDGLQAYVLDYPGGIGEGITTVKVNMTKGHKYKLYVVAVYDDDSTIMTMDVSDVFTGQESNLPASEITITPITMSSPYEIGFNVKAPNKDCKSLKYLCNTTGEWVLELNGMDGDNREAKIEELMDYYGHAITEEEVLSAINSETGYDFTFASEDETEITFAVQSFNEDEKSGIYEASAKSGKIPAKDPVNSKLFETLLGNWTATMTPANGNPITSAVRIGAGPEKISSLPADSKKKLIEYYMSFGNSQAEAEKTVEKYFKEYQEKTDYYTQKYKGQNFLVAEGFQYNEYDGSYMSSWALFNDLNYSSYDTDELFRDYGPKLFFEIYQENGVDKIKVATTKYTEDGNNYAYYVDPMANWNSTLLLMGCNTADPYTNVYNRIEFPVTVSEDGNTLTIESVTIDGVTYTPSIATEYMAGFATWSFQSAKGIVLTRTTSANALKTRAHATSNVKVSCHNGNHFRKTRLYGKPKAKVVSVEPFSMDAFKKAKKN